MKGFLIGLAVAAALGIASALVYPLLSIDTAEGWTPVATLHLDEPDRPAQ